MRAKHRAGMLPRPAFSSTKKAIAPSLLSVSIAAALGSVGSVAYAPKAHAQEAAPNQALEEVVVTGSRILRRDNSSNSPIVTVEADQFQAQMGLNFESYLNQLPEYNPANSPTTTQAAPACGRLALRRSDGSPRGAGCGSRCHPTTVRISTTCFSG